MKVASGVYEVGPFKKKTQQSIDPLFIISPPFLGIPPLNSILLRRKVKRNNKRISPKFHES